MTRWQEEKSLILNLLKLNYEVYITNDYGRKFFSVVRSEKTENERKYYEEAYTVKVSNDNKVETINTGWYWMRSLLDFYLENDYYLSFYRLS